MNISRAHNIMKRVAQEHGLTVEELISHKRHKRFRGARQDAAYEIRHRLEYSYPKIGRIMGGRDSTTIIYYVRQRELRVAS